VRLVVGQAVVLTGVGIGLGLLGALAMTRLLRSLLFGVSPGDPIALALVSALLLATAVAASLLPARSAARADPVSSMRSA